MPQREQKNQTPIILIALGGLLLLGAVIALAMQPGMGGPQAAETVDVTLPEIERVTLEEAKAAFDAGEALFVDVRGPGAYEAARVPGSILIPVIDFESRWKELDPNRWIITYCT